MQCICVLFIYYTTKWGNVKSKKGDPIRVADYMIALRLFPNFSDEEYRLCQLVFGFIHQFILGNPWH